MCYELAKGQKNPGLDPDQCYFVGLLSGIDIMLGVDKKAFFEKLPLSPETQAAVNNLKGPMGQCLSIALKLERLIQMKQRLETIQPRLLSTYRLVSNNVQELFNTI